MAPRLPRVPSWRDVDQLRLGVVSIVVLAALVTAAFSAGTLGLFSDRYELSAVFRDTGGIGEGDDVRVAGVPVGSVTGVHPDFETGQVVVSFEVDSGVALGPEATADISAATLLGGYYLRLGGPVTEPHLEDLDADDPRRRIPLERTSTPVALIEAISDATTQVQAIDIDAVNEVLVSLAGATDRNAEVVPELLDTLSTVGAAVADRDEELRELVAGTAEIGDVLAVRDQQIVTLIDAASLLLERLSERRDELATVLGDGSRAVATLTDTITRHRAAIDELLADGHVLLESIERNTETINTSLAWAGPMFTLLADVRSPGGGFDVAVEGFVGTLDQLEAMLAILVPPGGTP